MSQTSKYEITPDALQWVLRKNYITEKGNETEAIIGYYPKTHLALQAMYECLLRDSCLSIPGDLEGIEKAVARAENIFAELML